MKILCVGDVVGEPGRRAFKTFVPALRASGDVSAVVVNGENAAGGRGITAAIAAELFNAGADAITLGDHTFDQKDAAAMLSHEKRTLRPANYSDRCPGHGWTLVNAASGTFAVVNLLGRVFMNPVDNPFLKIDALLAGPIPRNVPIVVDFHAEATSEKIAMGWHLDGRVSALFGTHTHVPTADAKVLPGGTGYITDVGMTGPANSVIGREIEPVLAKFTTDMPAKFDVAKGPIALEGCIFDIDSESKKCRAATPVRLFSGN